MILFIINHSEYNVLTVTLLTIAQLQTCYPYSIFFSHLLYFLQIDNLFILQKYSGKLLCLKVLLPSISIHPISSTVLLVFLYILTEENILNIAFIFLFPLFLTKFFFCFYKPFCQLITVVPILSKSALSVFFFTWY